MQTRCAFCIPAYLLIWRFCAVWEEKTVYRMIHINQVWLVWNAPYYSETEINQVLFFRRREISLLSSITLKTFHAHSWTFLIFYSCSWFQTLLSELCCSCLNTLSPLLPCHGWSCLPSGASCSLFSARNHRGIWAMHKVHLSDVSAVTSGQLELSPWQRGMATELGGRSWDCTQRASQHKRKPYIVIPSFTFLWCNSEKYQICWIIDVFTPSCHVLLCQHCPELLQRQHLISFKRISCLVLNSTPQNLHVFLQVCCCSTTTFISY